MARDDLNHGDKQFTSTFWLQGEEGLHLPSNKDEPSECSGMINRDENGGSFNLMSGPCRLPPTSPFLHGDMVRMPQLVPGIDFPVDNCSKISYQQPSIGHGLKRVTDNSPNLHPLVPGSMDYLFQDPMYDSLITANNMQNVTTDLQGVQNPQFGGVFEPATFDANGNIQMARLDHEANNNIYMSSFTGNAGNLNNNASTLIQNSLGEEIGTGNSVLRSPIQSQGNLDGSFLTLGIGANMDLHSMGNSWRGTMPSNSQGLIFPQVTYNVQKATANPSESGAGGYFGLTDYTNKDVLANDNFGGAGSLASGFSLGHFCAPERPQADGRHSSPPKNRDSEWDTQAGHMNIGPSKLSQGSLFVSPNAGYSSQAELPNSRQSRGTEIPTLSSNSVLYGSGNFFPLSGQLMGSGEPISLQNNAQPVSNSFHGFSAQSIGKFLSQSSSSSGSVTWRNQSGNPGQPLPAAALQPFRNYLGPACTSSQATSLQTINASSQAFPVHIRSSLKRNAAESSTPTSLLQQKKIRTTQLSLYPSVPNVPLTTGALRSSAQTIPSLPSQLFTVQSTPPVPISASLASVSRPSSSIRPVPHGYPSLPSMSPSASPDPPVSNVAPILPSGSHAASLLGPRTYKVRSSPVPVLPQGRLLAKSTPDVGMKGQGLNETLQPIGEKCYICKRDLSFAPEGPISQPAARPDVAILPCRHTFHDICLQKITPQDQTANPPCIPCALGET